MPVVLVPIATLTIVLFVLALALAITDIMLYIANGLSGLPWPIDKLAGPVKSLASGIAGICGKLEHGVDHLIGASWHWMARFLDRSWHHMVADAHLGLRLAEAIAGHAYDLSGLRSLVHSLTRAWHGIEHGVKSLEQKWHGIEARVKAIERTIARGIGHDLRIQIKALERRVHGIEHGVIPGLRAGIKTAEGEVTQLQNFIKAIPGTRYLDWAAGIVTTVLSLEILNLLRCPQAKNVSNQRGCSMWGALDDLLGLVALGIVAADFETLVHEAQDLTEVATSAFDDVFGLSR